MADDRMVLLETMRKAGSEGDADFLRQSVKVLAEAVMEAEVTELTGVPHGERDPERRLTHRNGYRERRWDTRAGTIELAIPRVRDGSYFPSLLEPRRRAERALLAVVQEAYVLGVSTRRVEDLVETLGISGLSRSGVSRICAALDAEVEAFRTRPLEGQAYPYLWLDATYVKVRDDGRVVNMAALVATGVGRNGERRILGLELAAGNDEGSAWPAFIRSLVERASRASGSSSAMPMPASSPRSVSSSSVPRGNAVGSTSRAMPRISCPARPAAWSPRSCAPSSSSPTRPPPGSNCAGPSMACRSASRRWLSCSSRPRPTCSSTSPSLRRIDPASAARTHSSA
jgi:hypothetical protein